MASSSPKRSRTQSPWFLDQELINSELMEMLPELELRNLPHAEDILNAPPFSVYREYFHNKGEYNDVMPPAFDQLESRPGVEKSLGLQLGAIHSRYHTGQIVEPGSGKESHFREACRLADLGDFPTVSLMESEPDVVFAADQAVNRVVQGVTPQVTKDELKKLHQRCKRLDNCLRDKMEPQVRQVAGDMNIGFIAMLIIAMRWPDRKLPFSLLHGFTIVGDIEESGVFKPRHDDPPVGDPQQLLEDHDANLRAWFSGRPPAEHRFMVEECEKDRKAGFGSDLLTRAQVDRMFGRH